VVMGIYFLSMTLGNQFTSQVNKYISASEEAGRSVLQGADYYLFFAASMLVATVIFWIWSPFYRGKTHIQSDVDNDTPGPQAA